MKIGDKFESIITGSVFEYIGYLCNKRRFYCVNTDGAKFKVTFDRQTIAEWIDLKYWVELDSAEG